VGSTVLPSNNTGALLQQRFQLGSTQVDLPRDSSIAPLTQSLVSLGNRQLRVSPSRHPNPTHASVSGPRIHHIRPAYGGL
jgi:hypothetical protein